MAAVRARDVVLFAQRRAPPGGDRFLADGGVDEARNLPGAEHVADALLELTDRVHGLVHPQQLVLGDIHGSASSWHAFFALASRSSRVAPRCAAVDSGSPYSLKPGERSILIRERLGGGQPGAVLSH